MSEVIFKTAKDNYAVGECEGPLGFVVYGPDNPLHYKAKDQDIACAKCGADLREEGWWSAREAHWEGEYYRCDKARHRA